MKLKYVSNRSKFIDLNALRPRLMNLETASKLLESYGISDPLPILIKIMEQPIVMQTNRPPSPLMDIIEQYHIYAYDTGFSIQGIKMPTYQQALEYLIEQRKIANTDALRVLALAIDIADLKK